MISTSQTTFDLDYVKRQDGVSVFGLLASLPPNFPGVASALPCTYSWWCTAYSLSLPPHHSLIPIYLSSLCHANYPHIHTLLVPVVCIYIFELLWPHCYITTLYCIDKRIEKPTLAASANNPADFFVHRKYPCRHALSLQEAKKNVILLHTDRAP